MKNKFSSINKATILTFAFIFLFNSCSQKQEPKIENIELPTKNHTWYYFENGNFYKTEKPQNSPEAINKPWTEATRISCASVDSDSNDSVPKGYAIVNTQGILVFEDKNIEYCKDYIFTNNTAENIVFFEGTPIFSVYKNSFFNTETTTNKSNPFLIQFNPQTKIFYPILNTQNLKTNGNVIDFIWNGTFWTCCIKSKQNEKIDFEYLTFQPKTNILSITPTNANDNIHISQTSVSDYRKIKTPINFAKAPDRIKNLLKTLPQNISFELKCYTAGSHSPRVFQKNINNSATNQTLNANAIIAESWTAVLFQDGTLYLDGALYNKSILNKGNPLALRLPKLPAGYTYNEFVISGTSLYASWEETSFFKTGRSGFIQINLDSLLY